MLLSNTLRAHVPAAPVSSEISSVSGVRSSVPAGSAAAEPPCSAAAAALEATDAFSGMNSKACSSGKGAQLPVRSCSGGCRFRSRSSQRRSSTRRRRRRRGGGEGRAFRDEEREQKEANVRSEARDSFARGVRPRVFGGVFGDVFGGVSGGVFGCLLGGVCACACSGWAGLQCSQSAQSVSQSSRSVHSRKWRKRRNRGMRRQGNGHVCDSRCIHQVKTCWRERQHTLLDNPRALQQRHLASHSSPSSDQDALVQATPCSAGKSACSAAAQPRRPQQT